MKALMLSFALLVAMPVLAAPPVAKVSVLSSGKILLNGSPVDLAARHELACSPRGNLRRRVIAQALGRERAAWLS